MQFKRLQIIALALLVVLTQAFCFTMMADAAETATIDLSAERQLIRGFGGMNHPIWISDLTAEQRETAFGNGEGQLGFSILRIHVDENRNNWSRELATAKKRLKKGQLFLPRHGIHRVIWLSFSPEMVCRIKKT